MMILLLKVTIVTAVQPSIKAPWQRVSLCGVMFILADAWASSIAFYAYIIMFLLFFFAQRLIIFIGLYDFLYCVICSDYKFFK